MRKACGPSISEPGHANHLPEALIPYAQLYETPSVLSSSVAGLMGLSGSRAEGEPGKGSITGGRGAYRASGGVDTISLAARTAECAKESVAGLIGLFGSRSKATVRVVPGHGCDDHLT